MKISHKSNYTRIERECRTSKKGVEKIIYIKTFTKTLTINHTMTICIMRSISKWTQLKWHQEPEFDLIHRLWSLIRYLICTFISHCIYHINSLTGRKTPPKYSQPHCIVRFSPTGQIIKVSVVLDYVCIVW